MLLALISWSRFYLVLNTFGLIISLIIDLAIGETKSISQKVTISFSR